MPANIACLKQIENRLLWLSCWTVHYANHLRSKRRVGFSPRHMKT